MSHPLRSFHAHRPWPLPDRPHTFYQQWNRVWFLHYRLSPDLLQPLLPPGLDLHLFQGSAWASVVGFTMQAARLRTLPYPQLNFDELNLRTYAIRDGKPGVYFLSIEGGSPLSCHATRAFTGLPYEPAAIRRTEKEVSTFDSRNSRKNRHVAIGYRPGPQLQADELDEFLTERYCLYHGKGSVLRRFEVHHDRWPLQELHILDLRIDFTLGPIHLTGRPERAAYCEGVEVIAWSPERVTAPATAP